MQLWYFVSRIVLTWEEIVLVIEKNLRLKACNLFWSQKFSPQTFGPPHLAPTPIQPPEIKPSKDKWPLDKQAGQTNGPLDKQPRQTNSPLDKQPPGQTAPGQTAPKDKWPPDKQPPGQTAPGKTAPKDKWPWRTNSPNRQMIFFEIYIFFNFQDSNPGMFWYYLCFLVSLNEPTCWCDDLENPRLPSPFFPFLLSMTKYTFYYQKINKTDIIFQIICMSYIF